MGDEHDSDAGITQLTDGDEQSVNFLLGQSGGGLVHDDQLCVEQHSTADSNQLLGSNVQVAHLSIQVDVTANLSQSCTSGLVPALAVNQLAACGDLRVDSQVFTDSQVGEDRQVLVDDLNTQAGSFCRIDLGDLLTFESNSTFVFGVNTGNDLNQCGLAAAVLTGQAHDFTGTHAQSNVVQSMNAAKAFMDPGHFKQIFLGHGKLLLLIF